MNDPSEKGTGEDSESQLLWAHPGQPLGPACGPAPPYPSTDLSLPLTEVGGAHTNREGGEDPVWREAPGLVELVVDVTVRCSMLHTVSSLKQHIQGTFFCMNWGGRAAPEGPSPTEAPMESITLMLPHPTGGLLLLGPGLAVLPKTLPPATPTLEKPPRSPGGLAAQTHPIDILPWRLLPLSISALRSSPRPSSSVPTPARCLFHTQRCLIHTQGRQWGGVAHGSQSFHRVPAVAEGERHCAGAGRPPPSLGSVYSWVSYLHS